MTYTADTTNQADLDFDRQLLRVVGYDEAFIADYIARRTVTRTPGPIDSVTRKYRCGDCGYRHSDGVDVALEETITKPKTLIGYWACNECGSQYWENVRAVAADF